VKVTDVKTILLSYPYPPELRLKWSGGEICSWDAALVQVYTDQGISGLGEICFGLFLGEPVAALVDHFKKQIIGEDPFQIERLWNKMYQSSIFWNRHGFGNSVIAGVDIALYDLVGKATRLPVYQLLGGLAKARLKTYGSGGTSDSVDYLKEEVTRISERGFDSYKFRVVTPQFFPIQIKAIREIVGPEFNLMVDAVQGSSPNPFSFAAMARVAEIAEEHQAFWLEEPLRVENKEGYASLRRLTKVPIAGGEVVTEQSEFKDFFDREGLDYAQPDVTIAGGFTECKRIAALASCYNVPLAMHVWGTGVSLMANFHFGLATANCVMAEFCQVQNPLREGLLANPLRIHPGGYIEAPTLPGLGVQITDDFIARYPYQATGGHRMSYRAEN
jgi:L-alanine-DL-glutamate epimerase-like enolase superfamily enzyme